MVTRTDWGPGLVGALVFLAVVLTLPSASGLLVAAGLALLTYLGLRLLLPTFADDGGELDRLRGLARRVPDASVQARALRLCDTAASILVTIEQDGKDPRLARDLNVRWLVPTRQALERYLRLTTRGVRDTGDERRRFETQTLSQVQRALDDLRDRLNRDDRFELAAFSELMSLTSDDPADASAQPGGPR